ncbi:unnamed protein product [Trichogramma brassicae]|uniref:Uncharacterized protein n=1 Tax=Trichogramma brassicae TaxID=86971 RepID=A0A6H5IIM1_9HYME|nr:unnamed protein product [Trichogramma brassicae]
MADVRARFCFASVALDSKTTGVKKTFKIFLQQWTVHFPTVKTSEQIKLFDVLQCCCRRRCFAESRSRVAPRVQRAAQTRPLRASPLRRRALLHSSPPCANGQSARSCFLYKRGVRPSKWKSSLGCRPEHIDSRPRIRGDELLRVLT